MRYTKLYLVIFLLCFSFVNFAQTTEKKVILQGFWWNYYNANHADSWANYLCELAPRLKSLGIDAVWIPPTYKNSGTNSVGYSPFDHYDLGDKYQKGSTRTRVGTKDEVLRMIAVLHANGIEVIQDVVLNHVTNAGTSNGTGGQDPEATYSMATDGGFKNFRYACYQTPVPATGGENATEYLNRKGRWSKNYTNFHPNANWNVSNGNWESAFWGPDFAYGIDQTGTGNGYGQSTNATYNPTQTWNYNRDQARNWIMWYARQTGVDGFRWDAVKHFPHFIVQDLSYNLKYLNGVSSLGETMINFGEYVGGKQELDNWVNSVTYSNGGSDQLAGTFDFGLRSSLKDIISSQGSYDLSQIPGNQQNERVFHYINSNTYVHRTLPFVNNHDTFRPILSTTGNYTGWDSGNEIGGHIEPNEPRFSLIYALTFALDGTPLIYFEDLFNIGYNSNRFSHDPKSVTTLPVNSDLENILWCHQNLDFGTGAYLVRGHSGNTADHLIIERSAKAIIGINDNWNTWQSNWVDSNFPPGTVLVDYSGANGNTTRIVQNDQRVEISTPPCNGTAANGRRGYSIWAPQNIVGGYAPQRSTATLQEWEMDDDLGDSNCNSLQQGGKLPDNSIAYRNVGKIFANNTDPIIYKLIPSDNTKNLTIELLDINGNILTTQSGLDTLTGTYTATQNGWITIKIRNTTANQTGQKCWVRMVYTAPTIVDVTQFSVSPDVAIWTGNTNTDWNDCQNWQSSVFPDATINAIILTNSSNMPILTSGTASCKNLTIENNATLEISGGTLNIKGDLLNNGMINNSTTCGTIAFNGTQVTQNISGNAITFCKVQFANPNGTILNTNLTVLTQVTFSQGGKLYIENNDVTIAAIATVLAGNGYIVTKDNPTSGGSVIREVGSAALLFPIGSANSYTPIYLKSNTGSQLFNVRTFDQVYNNGNTGGVVSDIEKTVQQTWHVAAQGQNINANMVFYWNDTDQGTTYSRNNSTVIFNNNGFWSPLASNTVNGTNPYSQTANNVTQTGYFTVSNGTVSTDVVIDGQTPFSIVPNPSNGQFEIIGTNEKQPLEAVIFNALGKELLQMNGNLSEINQRLQLQMINQAKGIYFLRIKTEESNFTTLKIIIQ